MGMGWVINRIRSVVAIKPPAVFISDWVTIPSHTADALDANDAIGDEGKIRVPVSGMIQSAGLIDRDNEGSQIDVPLFDAIFAGAAGDVAFSLSDLDAQKLIITLKFATFDDNVNNQTSSLENLGKAYRVAPMNKGSKVGWMYFQGIARGTPTIAVGSEPMVRVEILPDEPV